MNDPKVRAVRLDNGGWWRAECECGWVGQTGSRAEATSDRWEHEVDHEEGKA